MRNLRFWLGLIVSLSFLLLLLWRVDLKETVRSLREANYLFVIPALALYFLGVVFRTVRWRLLLLPLRPLSVRRLFPVVVIGYMANNLLPVRLGELVRSYYLGQREEVSKAAALATIVVERVVDGVVLLFLLAALSLILPVAGVVRGLAAEMGVPWPLLVAAASAAFLLALSFMTLVAYLPGWALRWIAVLALPLPSRARARVMGVVRMFITGFGVLRYPKRLPMLFLWSLLVWLAEATMYFLVGFSFQLWSPLGGVVNMAAAVVALTAVSNLATALPSSQGAVGPFEWFAASTLVLLGVQGETAVAYVIALHAALLIPVTLLGLLLLWMGKESLVQLLRLGGRGAQAPISARAEETSP